ncbi:unnamed protein product [Vitrella brassicaformis CCMP3155]|uniref:Uncharacterized protein n=2 Tax=Vitrella brassicaformis TaxID=1169539 RepID=A0A0G4H5D5_VITBC|nr:unnamed protein product [Vitrella brassicaformis CCMP3155]|eukprot:CEM39000.1 unnamed protein product [Vitrella brassicaformis CCMP3155]
MRSRHLLRSSASSASLTHHPYSRWPSLLLPLTHHRRHQSSLARPKADDSQDADDSLTTDKGDASSVELQGGEGSDTSVVPREEGGELSTEVTTGLAPTYKPSELLDRDIRDGWVSTAPDGGLLGEQMIKKARIQYEMSRPPGNPLVDLAQHPPMVDIDEMIKEPQRITQDPRKAVVEVAKIPEDYLEKTLMPHLEHQIVFSLRVYTPAELARLSQAYARMPFQQAVLVNQLTTWIKDRLVGFQPEDVMTLLWPMYELAPNDLELWNMLVDKIWEMFEEFSPLNLLGVYRVMAKLDPVPQELIDYMLPQIRDCVATFDSFELNDVLYAIADHVREGATKQDMVLLNILLPEIERKYPQTTLLHTITNMWSLSRLQILHPRLLERATLDLVNPTLTTGLTPRFLAKAVWTWARFGMLDRVLPTLYPMIEGHADGFTAGEFARLAQALPSPAPVLARICRHHHMRVADMSRTDFSFFFLVCVRRSYLPTDPNDPHFAAPHTDQQPPVASEEPARQIAESAAGEGHVVVQSSDTAEGHHDEKSTTTSLVADEVDRIGLLASCLGYMEAEHEVFTSQEIRRIVHLVRCAPNKSYRYLLRKLPDSWQDLVDEALDREARGITGRPEGLRY